MSVQPPAAVSSSVRPSNAQPNCIREDIAATSMQLRGLEWVRRPRDGLHSRANLAGELGFASIAAQKVPSAPHTKGHPEGSGSDAKDLGELEKLSPSRDAS